MMPASLALRNRRASPWVSIVLCGLAWALALSFSFERLISIDLMLYGVSLIIEFEALVALRISDPGMARPFRIPGGTVTACVVSAGPVLLIFYAIYAARAERMAHMPSIAFGLIIAACGPVFYVISRKVWGHRKRAAAVLADSIVGD
jgi:amino acid transporter